MVESDPRYSAVEPQEREVLFDAYLRSISNEFRKKQRMARFVHFNILSSVAWSFYLRRLFSAEERLKEREREVRRKREKEEKEMDEQRSKVRLEEAIANFEALLSERVKQHDVCFLLCLGGTLSLTCCLVARFHGERSSAHWRMTDAIRALFSLQSKKKGYFGSTLTSSFL